VYVADFGNDRVQVFSTDGSPLGVLGSRGTGDGQFQRPAGVAVDENGGVYISDHFNDRIQKFSTEGRFETQLGVVNMAAPTAAQATSVPVQATSVAAPFGVQAAPIGTSIPTPTVQPTVAPTVNLTPVPTALIERLLRRPEGIALDRDGGLWVADYGHDRIVKVNPEGRVIVAFGSHGSDAGEFLGPKGVAVDPSSGRLYVADTGNGRVQRMSPDGTPEASWALPLP
jgi:DNA-binding beta-propeller fold protein YncE